MFDRKRYVIGISVCILLCAVVFTISPSMRAEELQTGISQPAPQVEIEQLENVPVQNDFSIGPTRNSLELKAGSQTVAILQITSRLEKETTFTVGVEDFTSQDDPKKYTKFLGDERGQFSSKEWFKPAVNEFTLRHGQRIHLPVVITVPYDVEMGEHYSAVFVKTVPRSDEVRNGITFSSRVGSLFLMKVGNGEVRVAGELESFATEKQILTSKPIIFILKFTNIGDAHLTPFGKITIKNIFGSVVDTVFVNDWVVLRGSNREQTAQWNPPFALGRYSATASIERGYENLVDTKTVVFYVIPVKTIVIAVGLLAVVLLLLRVLTSQFEIKRKHS